MELLKEDLHSTLIKYKATDVIISLAKLPVDLHSTLIKYKVIMEVGRR